MALIPRKIATTLLLAFSIVIAFYNILLGRPVYVLFVVPFWAAVIVKHKAGHYCEALGILSVSIYLMAAQALYIGIMGALVASVLFFMLASRSNSRIFIYSVSAIVGACAYFNPYEYPSIILAAILSASIYLVSAMVVHIALDNLICDIKKSVPLDAKCMDALESARDTAREAIAIAKEGSTIHGQYGAHSRT